MKVALVNMPFYSAKWASIQIGLLKAVLEKQGHEVEDHYLNLSFAKRVGLDFYHQASMTCDLLFGDWVFSESAFGPTSPAGAYLKRNEAALNAAGVLEKAIWLREEAPAWLDEVVGKTDWGKYEAVGFSCTFMQTVASLALAGRIKAKWPHLKIIFGGSSMEAEMGEEIARHSACVDCIIQGDGEKALGEILEALRVGKPVPRVYRTKSTTVLGDLPVPSYTSYYRDTEDDQSLGISLPLEASRGCWWGQKHHCKFCGLNGESLTYRSKAPDQVLSEIEALSHSYNRYSYQVVDNILDHRYFQSVLPKLVENGTSYRFFFEVKSNLEFSQLQLLSQAGVKTIQPGIESLDTLVLRLMDKGVSASQNINTLKWCRHFGMGVEWNLLFGFPGEQERSYQEMTELFPKLHHLTPPGGVFPLRMDRFSPYFKARSNGDFEDVRPSENYRLIYPKNFNVENLAYFFESKGKTQVAPSTYGAFQKSVEVWRRKWETGPPPQLRFLKGLESGHIVDTRSGEPQTLSIFGSHYLIAKALESKPLSMAQLSTGVNLSEKELDECMNDLIHAEFAVTIDSKVLWLPVSDCYRGPSL